MHELATQNLLLGLVVPESADSNSHAIERLARTLAFSSGQFALILACCDDKLLRHKLAKQLGKLAGHPITEITLSPDTNNLLKTLEKATQTPSSALMVDGLETVKDLDTVLMGANLSRNQFQAQCPFPLILWIDNAILAKLRRLAPDLRSWAGNPIRFESSPLSPTQKREYFPPQIVAVGV
ncbi:hypothetical protein IQ249_04525 [Lusitaniella coriacea LEGE 07157]|uniref:Uncharacterized protein n=1 Tax=Lusitaniella coriacea LEGE 07157 TaxID=945747 RepID=A0A8J7B771_9CYAN|nr:hypothetical protein [Lusitaniella coriacea]MBE9115159.1 hypothetical protein [Lusitaniella coriacea LEGE 07157]